MTRQSLAKIPGVIPLWHALKHHRLTRRFRAEYKAFEALSRSQTQGLPMRREDQYPCLHDRTAHTRFDVHYVYHTAWAARVVARVAPGVHVDISSSLYFSAIVSAFVPIRFFDYRPADLRLGNLETGRADLTRLPFESNSIQSISCMHVVEHIGLGRYGDDLDPAGDSKAMAELERVVAPGGHLLFVVPVGRPRICFNAHRVYSHGQVISAFSGLELREFTLIAGDGAGGLRVGAKPDEAAAEEFGCGCFWFQKPERPGGASAKQRIT